MSIPSRPSNVLPYRPDFWPRVPQVDELMPSDQSGRFKLSILLESVWHKSTEAMRITDSEGVIIEANEAYCQFVGMERGELLGEMFTIVYDESIDQSRLIEKYRMRFRAQSVAPMLSQRIRLANRKEVFVEASNSYITGPSGEAFLLSTFRDATERRLMEQRLERERSLLRTVIDNLPDRIYAKDVQSTFVINNEAHVRALGAASQAEVIGKTDFDFRPSEVAKKMLEDDREVIQSGTRIVEKEEWLHGQAGEPICVLMTKVPMRDKDNNVIGLVGISRNVTDRKRAEEALRESERNYHELFNNAVQGMFRSSVDGKLLSANASLLRMLGYDSLKELAFVNLAELYANPDERHALGRMLAERDACSNVELTLKRRDGTIIHALEHSRVVRNGDGTIIAYEGILEDISERRALENRIQEHLAALKASQESLAALNAQKDRLFSILSHDLRSPFTSILGFCEILLDENEVLSAAEREEFLGHIRNSAERQMALLNKLLDWSRLETGRIRFDAKDLDLSQVVAGTLSTLLGSAMKKEITLQSRLSFPVPIRGDEVLITQVFSNLISNALKFTPAHGLISVELAESREDQWTVAVKDTGAGIPKEDFKKLFKIEEKYTRKGLAGEEGTGLGLSVVDEILKKHSGSITVESEIGKGTTFFLHFPRLRKEADRCVLVVDDDEGVRVLHSRYLTRIFPDFQIIPASDGKEAFELAKRYRPRLIVTDYSMPEMNGFEFLTLLRQEETTHDIPVFVITGKDSTASNEALRLSGAAAVMTKPVSSAQLQVAVESVMANSMG